MEAISILDRGLFFPSGRLIARPETDLIVLHHTGGSAGEDPDAAEIDAIHRRLGWSGIGYHYLIRKDGSIEQGRPSFGVGAHAAKELVGLSERRTPGILRKVSVSVPQREWVFSGSKTPSSSKL